MESNFYQNAWERKSELTEQLAMARNYLMWGRLATQGHSGWNWILKQEAGMGLDAVCEAFQKLCAVRREARRLVEAYRRTAAKICWTQAIGLYGPRFRHVAPREDYRRWELNNRKASCAFLRCYERGIEVCP